MPEFNHLHVHSEYSLLDGVARIDELMRHTKELGMNALALTDHGVMYGAIEFYQKAKKHGVKPIIGCEMYIAQRRMDQKNPKRDAKPYHLTVLAKDETGYRNLMKLATVAQLEGFYYKPRVDRETLAEHSEGLLALSGCKSAEIPRLILTGQEKQARNVAGWHKDVFGPGNYYLELQDHDLDDLKTVNRELVALGKDLDLPLVATNDVHYVSSEDSYAQEIMLCIRTNTTIKDPNRMQYGDTFYLRSPEEMAALFGEIPGALRNTLAIAEKCNLDLDFDRIRLPKFPVPEGHTPQSYLWELCEDGLRDLYPEITPDIRERLNHELGIIHEMGFDNYFLIVWDLCDHARQEDIWWNVRGSAAGSIVAYSLGITHLDPLKHDLIFERFLNPGRVTMPDIDLDFPDDQRDELIQYTLDEYGSDRVAQIITFGTLGARAAVRDAGRALDLPPGEVDQVARLIPAIPGKPVTIKKALDKVDELRALQKDKEYIHELLDTAQRLEGIARHASTHAAGVVVADQPLVNYTPLHRPTRGSDEGMAVTQYPMDIVEGIGLLKLDFLGLSTLTILRRAVELIEEYQGISYDIASIPVDDPSIFELLSSGEVTGIFQVEGAGMRRVLTQMQPTKFEHIVAAISLYRPGPMDSIPDYIARMHGEGEVTYRHPRLKPILEETYGVLTYQEQIIRILTDLARYSAADADLIRRAVGKKKKKELLRHKENFIKGVQEHSDIPPEIGEAIFSDIEPFARYGFNKAHAADYATITCKTAYLKANYPVEYMTAMLSVEQGDTDKIAQLVGECHRLGIHILPPDVNRSNLSFTIEELHEQIWQEQNLRHRRGVRFGLGAVKNVGTGPVEAILAGRDDKYFEDIDDFCQRVDLRGVNRRALECLIRAGALDNFGDRNQQLAVVDRMLGVSQQLHRAQEVGQMSLFGNESGPSMAAGSLLQPLPEPGNIPQKQLLTWEKELLGVYVSEHPLHRVRDAVENRITATCGQIDESLAGQKVTVAGMVQDPREITTRKGDPMAFAQLEDLDGAIELVIFPRTYKQTKELWEEDAVLWIEGEVEQRDDDLQIICHTAEELELQELEGQSDRKAQEAITAPLPSNDERSFHLHVSLPPTNDQEEAIRQVGRIHTLLKSFPGQDSFSLYVTGQSQKVRLDFPNDRTRYCVKLQRALMEIVGEERFRVEGRSS